MARRVPLLLLACTLNACDDDKPTVDSSEPLLVDEDCDGVDDDCDGEVDEDLRSTWYLDDDDTSMGVQNGGDEEDNSAGWTGTACGAAG